MSIMGRFIVAAILISAGVSMAANREVAQKSLKDNNMMFAKNECIAKGGIGIINTSIYVDLKSANNELILTGGKRWTGEAESMSEVVIFFENRVWSRQSLPEGFDLSKAVIVSFEGNKVRFFDFSKLSGGFYRRHS